LVENIALKKLAWTGWRNAGK